MYIKSLRKITEVGNRVLVLKELFGTGFLKPNATDMPAKTESAVYFKACTHLSKGITEMKLWAGSGEWGLDRRTGGVETTVAKTVEMVICAEY